MSRTFCLCAILVATSPLGAPAQSPNVALGVGLASTLLPTTAGLVMWINDGPDRSAEALVIASGVVFGPAFGYWSAGMWGRGWKTVGLRTGLFLVSFVPAFAICGWNCSAGDSAYDVAWALVATGAGLGAASAVYDLARMKRNVREHRARRTALDISMAPTYDPQMHAAGMRVSVVF
jgi:hypothetical protein